MWKTILKLVWVVWRRFEGWPKWFSYQLKTSILWKKVWSTKYFRYAVFYTDSKISTLNGPRIFPSIVFFPSMVFSTRTRKFPPSAARKHWKRLFFFCSFSKCSEIALNFKKTFENFCLQGPKLVSKKKTQ